MRFYFKVHLYQFCKIISIVSICLTSIQNRVANEHSKSKFNIEISLIIERKSLIVPQRENSLQALYKANKARFKTKREAQR